MKLRHINVAAPAAPGLGLFTYGIAADGQMDPGDIRTLGLFLTLAAIASVIVRLLKPARDEQLERERQDGYDAGYLDGQQAARQVVVLRSAGARRSFSLEGSAGQFGQ